MGIYTDGMPDDGGGNSTIDPQEVFAGIKNPLTAKYAETAYEFQKQAADVNQQLDAIMQQIAVLQQEQGVSAPSGPSGPSGVSGPSYPVPTVAVTNPKLPNSTYNQPGPGGIAQQDLATILSDFAKSQNAFVQAQLDALAKAAQEQSARYEAEQLAARAEATAKLKTQQEDAIGLLTQTFKSYGLDTLAPKIVELVQNGYSPDTVSLLLQESPEYKQRFAANEARKKAGLAVLSPAEYLATERAYRSIMNSAGLPAGFYDQPDDFKDLMSKDISPAELQARVQNAADAVSNADPFYTQALRDMYGMSNGDMVAFVLNPDRSLPIIQQKANAVAFGAAAARQGITGIDNNVAEMYGGQGVGKQQAEQGFAQIASTLPTAAKLGQIYDTGYDTEDAMLETFGNNAQAAQKRRKLIQTEADTFSGQSGVRGGSLGTSTQGLI